MGITAGGLGIGRGRSSFTSGTKVTCACTIPSDHHGGERDRGVAIDVERGLPARFEIVEIDRIFVLRVVGGELHVDDPRGDAGPRQDGLGDQERVAQPLLAVLELASAEGDRSDPARVADHDRLLPSKALQRVEIGALLTLDLGSRRSIGLGSGAKRVFDFPLQAGLHVEEAIDHLAWENDRIGCEERILAEDLLDLRVGIFVAAQRDQARRV